MSSQQQTLMTVGSSVGGGSTSAYLETAGYTRLNATPAGFKVATDGYIYANTSGSYTSRYTWMTGSTPSSNYQVRATIISGTFSSGTSGAWTTISVDQSWTRTAIAGAFQEVSATFEIRDASTTSILASATITLTCDRLSDCPLCCFAPGTLIAMADVSMQKIEDVRVGDKIFTAHGDTEVTEVLVRSDRTMFRLEFDNGTLIDASDDHPFYVEDRGYCSLNPMYPYKNLGIPDTLHVGDNVRTVYGDATRLIRVTSIDCPEKVYTFAESRFFANGLLVY